MEKSGEQLENIYNESNGRFVYVKDHMNPHRSYAYGHAGFSVVYITENVDNTYQLQFKDKEKTTKKVMKNKIMEEIETYDKEQKMKNLFAPESAEYENIIKLAATTINPYRDLSIKERVQKMEELITAHEKFDTLEQGDLFLLGIERVKKSISFSSYGWLEVNYYANRNRDFFLIDREQEKLIISTKQVEIETYILKKLKVLKEQEDPAQQVS